MAASGHTPQFHLSQFGPNDRPSWIDDYNADMQTLDTAISGAQSDATEAKQSATVNSQEIQQVSQQMGDMQNTMLTADKAATMFRNQRRNFVNVGRCGHAVLPFQLDPDGAILFRFRVPR